MPSSIHPTSVTKNIPFSLALRIIRTCTSPDIRDMRLTELGDMLMYREYPERLVSSAIDRARKIPRHMALKRKIDKVKSKRPVFAVKFDPRLPSISSIGEKHWRAMVSQDQ